MDDLALRYAPMLRQIAQLYCEDAVLSEFVDGLTVNREEWDPGMRGGHFWFEETTEDADVEVVDAVAEDSDGATIAILLHLVGRRTNWAEWFRWDGEPILRWPPPSVRR